MKKAKEVHKLSVEELNIEVERLRKRMFELRTQAVTEKIQDTSQFSKVRKDIARHLTELANRMADGSTAAPAKPAKPAASRKTTSAKAGGPKQASAGRSSAAKTSKKPSRKAAATA